MVERSSSGTVNLPNLSRGTLLKIDTLMESRNLWYLLLCHVVETNFRVIIKLSVKLLVVLFLIRRNRLCLQVPRVIVVGIISGPYSFLWWILRYLRINGGNVSLLT